MTAAALGRRAAGRGGKAPARRGRTQRVAPPPTEGQGGCRVCGQGRPVRPGEESLVVKVKAAYRRGSRGQRAALRAWMRRVLSGEGGAP